MGHFIISRLLQALLAIVVLGIFVFILARMTGNPVDLLLPADATEEDRQYMIKQLGLDRPYHVQFVEFFGGALRGDFGKSIRFGRPTTELFFSRLPNTLKLAGVSLIFSIIIAIPLGVLAGANRGTRLDSGARVLAVIGISAPSFWVGLVMMDIFAVRLGWLPAARMGGIDHYILPSIALGLGSVAAGTRLLRSSTVDIMDSEFVKLARIKGVSTPVVLWKHCLRNALIPYMTSLGMHVGVMLSGAIVIETVFAWPGVGRLAYEGIVFRDYPLVQTVVMIKGALVILTNLVVDILYGYVDPRIRVTG
ncbi:MAG: transporter permease [Dehalococcoidales bacterium]|nr:transporter permease [Dehalococcoidales bacterium]